MLSLTETDNGRALALRPEETIRISLPENAAGGYRWSIDRFDHDVVEALATEPRYASKAVGSGGEVTFSFKARKAGTGEIALKYWRDWEGESSVSKRYRVTLNVKA
jgi:inhibitor of cysteine peptidase